MEVLQNCKYQLETPRVGDMFTNSQYFVFPIQKTMHNHLGKSTGIFQQT